MSQNDSILSEALERVDLFKAAGALGIHGLKNALQKSPFRTDHHGKSFSVFDQGKRFKDHARDDHAGGTWHFVNLARPEWTRGQTAEFIIQLAGLDPAADGKRNRAGFKRFNEDMRRAMYDERRRALHETKEFPELQSWPAPVKRFWIEGREHLGGSEAYKRRLADSRGWPVAVVDSLLELDLISAPWLPWSVPGRTKAQRGIAFKVEYPLINAGNRHAPELRPVGYHQRYRIEGRNAWTFAPYEPQSPHTAYQKALRDAGRKVYPLPFVLGDVHAPRLIIILEGQWDAITFFHACGWFDGSRYPGRVAVFGMRGTQSTEAFLSLYGSILREHKPAVLLMGDNDEAGRAWLEPREREAGLPLPCFLDRIKATGAGPVVSAIHDATRGPEKDFNDYYKSHQPSPANMLQWLNGQFPRMTEHLNMQQSAFKVSSKE